MSLDLPHGGHLSHGYQTPQKKVSMVSKYFEVLPYRLDINTGYYFTIGMIDYKDLESLAERYRPKLIVAGVSAYSRLIDYERISKVCKSIGSYLLADMAHVSGLMAAG